MMMKKVISCLWRAPSSSLFSTNANSNAFNNPLLLRRYFSTGDPVVATHNFPTQMLNLDINSQIGSTMPLSAMRIGTIIHNIEIRPGQGGKLVRAAGTGAKILKENLDRNKALKQMLGRRKTKKERDDERERKRREKAKPTDDTFKDSSTVWCLVKLPSGAEMLIDSQCRATIGMVSNASHSNRKLRKAGQKRWLGRRPVVRGVAMNPVDHPHGGGEGRSKSSGPFGRVSQTPWGKPTKSGYKTGPLKRKK